MHDPNFLASFASRAPYHADALLQLGMVFAHTGQASLFTGIRGLTNNTNMVLVGRCTRLPGRNVSVGTKLPPPRCYRLNCRCFRETVCLLWRLFRAPDRDTLEVLSVVRRCVLKFSRGLLLPGLVCAPPTVDGSSIGVRRAVPLRPGERCHGVFSACGRSLPSRRHPRGQQDILCGHVPTHAGVVWNDASVVTASTTCMTKHRGVRGQALFLFHPAIAL